MSQMEILAVVGLVVIIGGGMIAARIIAKKVTNAVENKYTEHKNKVSPPTETPLSDRHKK